MTKLVLVKCWKGNSRGLPKGKINQGEPSIAAAVREASDTLNKGSSLVDTFDCNFVPVLISKPVIRFGVSVCVRVHLCFRYLGCVHAVECGIGRVMQGLLGLFSSAGAFFR